MNPDTHLLYEYMNKLPFTVRMKVRLDQPVDAVLLNQAAQEAIVRFPYFSVRVGLDESQSYALEHNNKPLAVLPEADRRLVLGGDEVNGHLVAITYRDDSVWFNFSHALCGAYGALFWVKSTFVPPPMRARRCAILSAMRPRPEESVRGYRYPAVAARHARGIALFRREILRHHFRHRHQPGPRARTLYHLLVHRQT